MRFLFLAIFSLFLLSSSHSSYAACSSPAGKEGEIFYNDAYKTFQGCAGDKWMAFHKRVPSPCTGTTTPPSAGETCTDGTIYAGDTPDGNVPMYTTASDQSAGTAFWGTSNFATGSTSFVTGQANSADVYAHVQAGDGDRNPDDGDTPNAFVLCEELTANGHDDWYLPAVDELAVLYANKDAGALNGTFDETSGYPESYYWSSSEGYSDSGHYQQFDTDRQNSSNKFFVFSVRCVRR